MTDSMAGLLAEGRAALREGDASRARAALELIGADEVGGDHTELLARVSYLEHDFRAAIEQWELAYAQHRDSGDAVGAGRAARSIAYMNGAIVGDWAVSQGWMARAQTLLDDTDDSAERGWVALNIGMFEADRVKKDTSFRKALEISRAVGDTDLEFTTLAYLGASLVHGDRTEEGMLLLDEALAAVAGRDVDDFLVLEEIFCQLFAACEHAQDVARADQWIRVGEVIAERRKLPAVSAFCRTHYGGVLTAAGRWPEADEALTAAVRLWGLGQRSMLRSGALVRLADLRVRQGRFEEAEQLLEGLAVGVDEARPVAAIHLARGETARARDVIERALAMVDPTSSSAVPLLALLVEVRLADGEFDAAERVADDLSRCAAHHDGPHLRAAAALAQGRVCLASGTGDPQACLREALAGFQRAQMPMEMARSRLELASALVDESPEIAMAEARTALEAFERLEAARHVDAACAVLRTLGVRTAPRAKGAGILTKREEEVLDLVGHGLSNPEIAERLFISRKTVEHHMGNVLAKLNLRSRAEAAAYAERTKPAAE